MREIKFRAWNKTLKKWDFFTPDNILTYIQTWQLHILEGDELYLYTGLKDKNGKEIYEGDIVEFNSPKVDGKLPIIDEVYYNTLEAQFEAKKSNFKFGMIWPDCEVIGNIHENPELLEQQ